MTLIEKLSARSQPLELVRSFAALWPLTRDQRLAMAGMIVLGLASAIAEGMGISLVIILVYMLVDGSASWAGPHPGVLGSLLVVIGRSPLQIGIVIAALVLLRGILSAAYGLIADWVGSVAEHRARVAIFNQYLGLKYDEILRYDQGELLNKVSYESGMISEAIIKFAGVAINFLAILVYSVLIAIISSYLASLVLVLGLFLFTTLGLWARWLAAIGAEVTATNERLFVRMLSGVQALRTVRMFGAEASFRDEFSSASARILRSTYRLTALMYVSRPIRDLGLLSVLCVLLVGAHALRVETAVVVTVVALLYRLMPHVTGIEDDAMAIFGLSVPLRNAVEFIGNGAENGGSECRKPVPIKFREMVFESVSYRYPGAEYFSLNDVTFGLRPGWLVAVTGPSGSGKTTLTNLIARLHEPVSGDIRVDGVSLCEYDRLEWLARTAFAGQDVELVEGTVAENVRLGRNEIPLEGIRRALQSAEILDFIETLPKGLDARIGDRGLRLSGGQRQRIGIARAIVGRPAILVLDEATSALDLEMESRILSTIRTTLPNTTIIAISHRANIEGADLRLCLEWGYSKVIGAEREDVIAWQATL